MVNASNEPVLGSRCERQSLEYAQRFKKVQDAFDKLESLKVKAFPILVKHFDDKRQSINFRNHYLANRLGMHVCGTSLSTARSAEKLLEVRLSTKGARWSKSPQAILEGTPFDDAGGMAKWLEQNKDLSYMKMQIKCLNWLLDGEENRSV